MSAASEEELRTAFLTARQFLRRLGWTHERIAREMGVSQVTARQYAQAPGTQGSRNVQADRLARLQAAVDEEAAILVLQAKSIGGMKERFGR